MNILIIGVSGFIGRHLYDALSQQGHHVTGCSRSEVPNINWQKMDFKQSIEGWEQQLHSTDIVINAAGIYQETNTQLFSEIHEAGPKKLFTACNKHSIKVIQISAIGAEQQNPITKFLQSKRNADQALLGSTMPNVVLYPGIVLGEQGKSTRQLSMLARLICIPLVFGRNRKLPLISIYQLTDRVAELINNWPKSKMTEVLVAQPETMEHMLSNLRQWMYLGKGRFITIQPQLINLFFKIFPKISFGALNKQSIDMLSAYSDKNITPITKETASESLLKYSATTSFKRNLKQILFFHITIITLAFIWIMSGISSIANIEQSRELISLTGVSNIPGDIIIFIAAMGDIVLGILLFFPRLRRAVVHVQIFIIVIYSLIISIFIPAFWLHPFAPIIKNLAMVVLALYLLIEEKE